MAVDAVCLFPGQGSQRVGMGRDLAEAFPVARRAFEEADDRLEMALSRLCFEGPEDRLQLTEFAQPAIMTVSVAAYRVLQERAGFVPVAVAGHSLGEWSALVAAGAIDFGDAVAGVRERGRLMQEAVAPGEGAMAALIAVDAESIATLCAEAAGEDVLAPANMNGGGQIVVAGHASAVERLLRLAAQRRVRAQRLPVSAPFHCALMAPAAAALERYLEGVGVRDPVIPVVTSVEARLVRGASEVRPLLVRQVTQPVRWEETVRAVAGLGASVALEAGPGRVLIGLLRRTVPDLEGLPVGDVEGVTRACERLQ